MSDRVEPAPAAPPRAASPYRWGFGSALAVVLLLLVVGQAIGVLMRGYPPQRLFKYAVMGDAESFSELLTSFFARMEARDWTFTAFLFTAAGFVWVQRAAVKRFFRAMHVGVTLVVLTAAAVTAGVLVPQMEGFEDPETRITAGNYEEQYKQFRWAQGYFLWHLGHLYGQGLPESELPPPMRAGLERFARRYGEEEGKNREKQMVAALSGQQKTRGIGEFVQQHDGALRTYFDVATALELNRTYKSSWFATLLALLGTGIVFNTFKGSRSKWLSIHKVGFFVTHIGMLTILVGGCVSNLATDRGILHLDLRDPPQDVYYRHYDSEKRARMPFSLELERFARKDWKQIQVWFAGEDFKSNPPEYTLWPDRTIDLDYREDEDGVLRPHLRVHVLELAEKARVEPLIRESFDPEQPGDVYPIAEVRVPPAHHAPHAGHDEEEPSRRFLAAFGPYGPYVDPDLSFRLRAAWGTGEAPFPEEEGLLGTLALAVTGSEELDPRVVPARVGAEYELPGGYRARVERATANFRVDPTTMDEVRDPRPLEEQPPLRPAVWLEITAPDGATESRPVLSGVDWEQMGVQDRFQLPDVKARLDWDEWSAPGPPRFVLHWGLEQDPRLLGEDGSEQPVELDRALPLPSEAEVVLVQLVHRAEPESRVEFLPPSVGPAGLDEDFYAMSPRGLRLEVVRDPGQPSERVDVAELTTVSPSDVWRSSDGELAIRFFENDRMLPFEWRSVLKVHERDEAGRLEEVPLGPPSQREIRVNDYFHYRGYRFFQTNAIPEIPTYSGVGVVYDPGIPLVLAGMYIVIAGTALAFLVKPIVLARRQRRTA